MNQSSFFLIEKLAETIAEICLANKKVHKVTVCVDKLGALRFSPLRGRRNNTGKQKRINGNTFKSLYQCWKQY